MTAEDAKSRATNAMLKKLTNFSKQSSQWDEQKPVGDGNKTGLGRGMSCGTDNFADSVRKMSLKSESTTSSRLDSGRSKLVIKETTVIMETQDFRRKYFHSNVTKTLF